MNNELMQPSDSTLCPLPPEFEQRLKNEHIPLRISSLNPYGWPTVVSLWTHFDGECFICATQASAKVVQYLKTNPKCGFEISSNDIPYWGIRGHGTVVLDEQQGKPILEQLLLKYVDNLTSDFSQRLLKKADNEVAIIIQPKQWYWWDFSKRMADVT